VAVALADLALSVVYEELARFILRNTAPDADRLLLGRHNHRGSGVFRTEERTITGGAAGTGICYHCHMADAAVTGVLHGKTITLDDPVPPLDGRRVRVFIAPEDREIALAADEQARLWDDWAREGPQGPIEDDGEPEFP
jgi:hypothetical protein